VEEGPDAGERAQVNDCHPLALQRSGTLQHIETVAAGVRAARNDLLLRGRPLPRLLQENLDQGGAPSFDYDSELAVGIPLDGERDHAADRVGPVQRHGAEVRARQLPWRHRAVH